MTTSKSIAEQAKEELQAESAKEAKEALKGLYRRKANAEAVVRGIDREIEVALAKIEAGEKV